MSSALEHQPLPSPDKWFAMMGVGLGVFMATLDTSIVNISLPTLTEQLHTSFAIVQWVVLSYALVVTALMLSAARLGDMLDKKKLYLVGLTLFTIGSFLCGLSPAVGWLIGFRALQGLGATLTQALGMAIITEIFPVQERGRALGIIGGVVSVGIAVGPPIGGILIGLVGWRAVFLVNVPVGILAALVVSRFVPSSIPARKDQQFDRVGAVVLLTTLAAYALGMTLGQQAGFENVAVIVLLVLALLGVVTFVILERRTGQPMVDLSLFRNVLFSLNLVMGFLVFIVMAGNFIVPFFLELVQGYSTEQVGILMMSMPIAMGLVAPWAGSLSDRFGSRGISLVGLLIIAGGCLALGTLNSHTPWWGFVLRMVPFGVGMGFFQSPNNSAIMGAAPRQQLGIASGLLSLSRTLGQTTGLPLMGAVFTARILAVGRLPAGMDATRAPAEVLVSGVTGTYQIAAFFILASTMLAGLALWIDTRRQHAMRQAAGLAHERFRSLEDEADSDCSS